MEKSNLLNWPPKYWDEIPLPEEFKMTISPLDYGVSSHKQLRALEQPFTPEWDKTWNEIAVTKGFAILGMKASGESGPMFPGALSHYQSFKDNDGIKVLKILSGKGADPNIILGLFIKYLWSDNVSRTEHTHWKIIYYQEALEAVQKTREFYLKEIKFHFEMSPSLDPQKFIEIFGSRPREEVELALSEMEAQIRKVLGTYDFRRRGQGSPSDKEGRVVFYLHHYIKHRTDKPRWQTFLDLLVSAGVVKVRQKKRRDAREFSDSGPPSSRLLSRIKSFQKDHPKEAQYIKYHLIGSNIGK